MQRREEEGRGKERRKALLEKEERKWKEIEASFISSLPNAGSREAAAMAAAVRAVGGDSVLEDSFARERVSSIAHRIRKAQLDRRAVQVISVFSFPIMLLAPHILVEGVIYVRSSLSVVRLGLLAPRVYLTMNQRPVAGIVAR